MTTNTQRAAALVRSFKQVAVDQSSDDIRSFNLKTYLSEVLLSLQPKLKGRPVKVEVDCAPDIVTGQLPRRGVADRHQHADEFAGARLRARAGREDRASAPRWKASMVVLDYSDDGAGMDADTLAKLFDPFFTTRRGSGGSGLGAHILYNLVTGPLGGTVKVESAPGQGLRYHLRFPRSRRKEKLAA